MVYLCDAGIALISCPLLSASVPASRCHASQIQLYRSQLIASNDERPSAGNYGLHESAGVPKDILFVQLFVSAQRKHSLSLIIDTSVQFALFKTYGIPTISQLLVATKEFSTPENASKRYADTGVLIQEFTTWNPKNERTIKAIARMNYIHSRYQKAGKISNDDLLYTLSVFITEPISWVRKFEWRPMSDMEICAVGTLCKTPGELRISCLSLSRKQREELPD